MEVQLVLINSVHKIVLLIQMKLVINSWQVVYRKVLDVLKKLNYALLIKEMKINVKYFQVMNNPVFVRIIV